MVPSSFFLYAGNEPPSNYTFFTEQHYFIKNNGQWPEEVLYLSRQNGLDAWVTRWGLRLNFYRVSHHKLSNERFGGLHGKFRDEWMGDSVSGHVVDIKFYNSGADFEIKEEGLLPMTFNFYGGQYSSRQIEGVGACRSLLLKGYYPGIDLVYHFVNGKLRFDFNLDSGVDPATVRFEVKGNGKLIVKEDQILVKLPDHEVITISNLKAYQGKQLLPSRFVRDGESEFILQVTGYDATQPMLIDPIINSTYLGGNGFDVINDMSKLKNSDNGHYFIVGRTASTNFPTSVGAYQNYLADAFDAFVGRVNMNSNQIVYMTYFGGDGSDAAFAVDVIEHSISAHNRLIMAGSTSSANFPVTTGALQSSYGGGVSDAFVALFNLNNGQLIYSTFWGGNGADTALGIVVTKPFQNNRPAYLTITGKTSSSNLSVTSNAFQSNFQGGTDAFVALFRLLHNNNPSSSYNSLNLLMSTYLGGSAHEAGYAVVNNTNYSSPITFAVGGMTSSVDFPAASGYGYTGGSADAFYFSFEINNPYSTNAAVTVSNYSAVCAGENATTAEAVYAMSIINNETVFTYSNDSFFSTGESRSNNNSDAFRARFSLPFTNPFYPYPVYDNYTYYKFGGCGDDWGTSIHNKCISLIPLISGITHSQDFPVTQNAFQSVKQGSADGFVAFVSGVNPNLNGSHIRFASYLGGSGGDFVQAAFVDETSLNTIRLAVAGGTQSLNFPISQQTLSAAFINGEGFLSLRNGSYIS